MERKASDNTPRAWAHPAETPGRGREFHGYSREELGHTATPRGNESSPTYLAPPGRQPMSAPYPYARGATPRTPRVVNAIRGNSGQSMVVQSGGMMPTPPNLKLDTRRVKPTATSVLSQRGTPRLAQWTLKDAELYQFQSPRGRPVSGRGRGEERANPEVHLSRAFGDVEAMLSGQVPLEDFVDSVNTSSGMERWALWMEMSGRMQMSLAASRAAMLPPPHAQGSQQYNSPAFSGGRAGGRPPSGGGAGSRRVVAVRPDGAGNPDDENLLRSARVARSIMKRQILATRETQTDPQDFPDAEPFLSIEGGPLDRSNGRRASTRPRSKSANRPPSASVRGSEERAGIKKEDNVGGYTWGGGGGGMQGKKAAALHLASQLPGLSLSAMASTIARTMPPILGVESCQVLLVDPDSDGKALLHYSESSGEIPVHVPADKTGIAGKAMSAKRLVLVTDVSENKTIQRKSDLGPRATGARWEKASLLALPILGSDQEAVGVLCFSRVEQPLGEEEVELAAWLAVVLAGVMQETSAKQFLQSQLALMEVAGEALVSLSMHGCEIRDPEFWMSAFRAQVAQIVFVFPRRAPDGTTPLALFASSRDISHEEQHSHVYPLRGICRRLVDNCDGEPVLSLHAESEPDVHRGADLGGSDFEGRTSLIAVPILNADESDVIAVITVSSTQQVYAAAHVQILRAMSFLVRAAVRDVIAEWRADTEREYLSIYADSEDITLEDQVIASQVAQIENAEREAEEAAEAAQRLLDEPPEKSPLEEESVEEDEDPSSRIYEFSREGINTMIDQELKDKAA